MYDKVFNVSFYCYYPDDEPSKKYQDVALKDIPRWIDSYKFTHPNCKSITFRIWFNDQPEAK